MIRFGVLLAALGSLIFLWHECGQDPGVFCYRMGLDIFSAGRERFLVPAPWVAHWAAVQRNQDACCNLFYTFSTRFSTQKD